MDQVGKAIYSILSADPALGQLVAYRIYPVIAPQHEVYPILTYAIITNTPSDTKTSASTVDQYRIQFDAYATEYDKVHSITNRLRELIDRYPHTVVAGILLDGIRYLDQSDGYDDESQLFRVTVDYYMRVKRGPIDITLNECYDLQSFHFTLPVGDVEVDCGFLVNSNHLVFGGYLGPLIHEQDYTIVDGTKLRPTDAPFPNEVNYTIVRNRVRVREYTQPADTDTILIGSLLVYPVIVFVGDTLQILGVDYTIDTDDLTITWPNHNGVEFEFKIVANACQQ
jgi:hypothetical protein